VNVLTMMHRLRISAGATAHSNWRIL